MPVASIRVKPDWSMESDFLSEKSLICAAFMVVLPRLTVTPPEKIEIRCSPSSMISRVLASTSIGPLPLAPKPEKRSVDWALAGPVTAERLVRYLALHCDVHAEQIKAVLNAYAGARPPHEH